MAEPQPPQLCARCNFALGTPCVTIVERDTASIVLSDWTFCSWECAREQTIHMVRTRNDER